MYQLVINIYNERICHPCSLLIVPKCDFETNKLEVEEAASDL